MFLKHARFESGSGPEINAKAKSKKLISDPQQCFHIANNQLPVYLNINLFTDSSNKIQHFTVLTSE